MRQGAVPSLHTYVYLQMKQLDPYVHVHPANTTHDVVTSSNSVVLHRSQGQPGTQAPDAPCNS